MTSGAFLGAAPRSSAAVLTASNCRRKCGMGHTSEASGVCARRGKVSPCLVRQSCSDAGCCLTPLSCSHFQRAHMLTLASALCHCVAHAIRANDQVFSPEPRSEHATETMQEHDHVFMGVCVYVRVLTLAFFSAAAASSLTRARKRSRSSTTCRTAFMDALTWKTRRTYTRVNT
jgi:hypothetical protein